MMYQLFIILYFTTYAGSLSIEPKGHSLWIKASRPLTITCLSERDVSWYKDGSSVKSSDDVIINKQRTTAVNKEQHVTTLIVENANTTHSGNYSCIGGKEHDYINVKVVNGHLKVYPSGRVNAFEGDTLTMTCEYEGDTKLDVMWYKDDREQLSKYGFVSNRRTLASDKITTRVQLTKTSLEASDTGVYQCLAGPFSKKTTLEVLTVTCNNTLITGINGVSDEQITASSYYKDLIHDDSPRCSRLINSISQCGAWSPVTSNNKQWIQVSFKGFKVIRSIITSGRLSNDSRQEWVQSYRITYSQNGIDWNKYKDKTGQFMDFTANFDATQCVTNKLPVPIVAKFIRLNPTSWNGKIALRLEVEGCLQPSRLQINEINRQINVNVPASLTVECIYSGPVEPDIVWYKDNVRLLNSAGYFQAFNTSWLNDRVLSTATLKKDFTTYDDSAVYTCVDQKTLQRKSVLVDAANLEMKQRFDRIWILSASRLQISCEYKGKHGKEITWIRNKQENLQTLGFFVTTNKKIESRFLQTTSTITKEKITIEDRCNITCSAADLHRTVEVIVVSSKRETVRMTPGQNLTLPCGFGVIDTLYSFEIYWTKNYIPLNLIESVNGKYEYSSDTRLLTVHRTDMKDAGHYECNILLEPGTSQQQHLTVPIEVNAQPEVSLEGQSEVKNGDTLHLYCKVTGYPVPDVSWYKDGEVLTTKDNRYNVLPYGDIPNGHLVLFDANINDRGIYECKASSVQFEAVKSELTLHIKDEPIKENLLLICVAIAGTVIVVTVICCVACIKCRSKHNEPVSHDILERDRPLLMKRYVDMEVVTRSKSLTSLEEIDRLPPPPPPIDHWDDDGSTIEDTSLTYERIPKFRERKAL